MNSQKKREGSATFIKGELVYAKIRGYPWWPAVVSIIIEWMIDSEKLCEVINSFYFFIRSVK